MTRAAHGQCRRPHRVGGNALGLGRGRASARSLGRGAREEPTLPDKIVPATSGPSAPSHRVSTVSQDDRAFHPTHVALSRGGRLWIVNNDTRTHNVRVFDPALDFDSGAHEPGETVEIAFPASGSFLVFCGIHPKMELYVEVVP